MTLTINHPEVDELAHELSNYTGETITQAVLTALRERLEREKEKQGGPVSLKEEILRIGQECAALPILDNRSAEEIINYILKAGKPVVEVKPIVSGVKAPRPFGLCAGEFTVPDDFDAPLSESFVGK